MLPKLDFNVVDVDSTRYRRTHPVPVAETESKLRSLYGAWKVLFCSSGMEALNTAVSLIQPRTVIVDDETYFEFRHNLQYLAGMGGFTFVQIPDLNDLADLEQVLKYAWPPVMVCGDSPTTFGRWKNVPEISALAHRYGAYVMMDNSIVSLYYSTPIAEGADLCAESYTKYVTGQGDTFAGGLALAESMRWLLDKPVPVPTPGVDSVMWIVSRRGNIANPLSAYNVSKGLETLEVRMQRHTDSAAMIFRALQKYSLPVLYSGKGGLITLLGIKPDFCSRMKHFVLAGTFGCSFSNADFFRSDANYKAGICTRLSIGLEDPDLLLADIIQALNLTPRQSVL